MCIVVEVVLIEEGFQVVSCDVERGFEGTALLACLDGAEVGTVAGQQAYGTEQDALAGTGLTGNGAEAFVQVNIEVLDQSIVFYV